MGLMDDQMATDAVNAANADLTPGVEGITYKPAGASSFTANVVVTRHPPDVPGELRNWNITIFLAATASLAAVNTAGDLVNISPLRGGTGQDLSVVEVLEQSAAGWLLLLR